MTDEKKHKLDAIITEIFQLDNPGIDRKRETQISDFIMSAVNGDMPAYHLVINASVDSNNLGVIVYILTNLRLIKVDISNTVKSNSFPLSTLIGVTRNLVGNEIEFSASFQNGSFGLRYSQDLKDISDFFQKIEPIERN